MDVLQSSPLPDPMRAFATMVWAAACLGLTQSVAAQNTGTSNSSEEESIIQTLNNESLPALISALTDKGKTRHFRLIHVLGDVQDLSTGRYLMQAYEDTDSEGIRCKILESMGKLHDPTLLSWFNQRVNDPLISIQ